MNIEQIYKDDINNLMLKRGSTVLHITGIRHCDFKDNPDAFIEEAAKKMLYAGLFPEIANQYDCESVSCRYGRKKIGFVTTYDLEKYYILAEKDNADHLTGHFGQFSADVEDHLLKLYMPGTITLDDITEYRKKVESKKDAIYGSWKYDAIDHYLVHSEQQDEARSCITQLKEHVLMLYGGHSTSTCEELTPILDDYKLCSQYDISLEGQQERWDILLYLDLLHDHIHRPEQFRDKFYEVLLKDVEDVISQIGGELVRSVSYKSYSERLSDLVTKHLPLSKTAQHYLNTLPSEAFDDIRQQVEKFPHYLYRLFRTNSDEFVRTLYYARIPRKYLDPFLSGIALVEAYDESKKVVKGNVEHGEKEKLNYYAPQQRLGDLLCKDWFDDVCTDKEKYTAEWRLGFVESLMESEHRDYIAKRWAVENKRVILKCILIGSLKEAGVLKGSNLNIARKLDFEDHKTGTIAEYMGYCRKESFWEWVEDYVKK